MAAKFIHFLPIILVNFLIFSHGRGLDEKALERKYGKVVHLSVIFRHGDRSPYSIYPRDPHKSYLWPDGAGQLLEAGKLRLYNLGKWFRRHYNVFLNTIHSHTRMVVESSDTDRTIMSAQYFMASFFEPNKTERVSKNIRWQPIPIHTYSLDEENYISMYTFCPREEYYKKKFFKTPKMKKLYDEHEKTFDYLRRHTDLKFSKNDMFHVTESIYSLLDTLKIEESYNLTLPSWTKKVYPRALQKLQKLFVYSEFSDSRILRLKAGPIMKSITADMESAKNLTNDSRKLFHFYSGHDVSIVVILSALGNYNGINPPVGSALVLEMRNKGKENFIVVRYKNSASPTFQLLDTPKCGKPCTVEKFIKMSRPLMIANWKLECQLKGKKNQTVNEHLTNF